tara:strand:+ start:2254 stop:3663 length:1410 start_codon:yes stop_codon:yes gene_type:complete
MNSRKCLGYLTEIFDGDYSTSETLDQFHLSGAITNVKANSLATIKQEIDNFDGWQLTIRDGEYSEISIEDAPDTEVNISVSKPAEGLAYFFTAKGFKAALQANSLDNFHEIRVLGEFNGFLTRRFSVLPWAGEVLSTESIRARDHHDIDPRRALVRDLTGSVVPKDPYSWMLLGKPSVGEIWETWKNLASQRLSCLLASEIWNENGQTMVSLNGARRRTFTLEENLEEISTNRYLKLCEAVEWMLVHHDTEARHEVLIRRLATLAPENEHSSPSWSNILPQIILEALDGARLDHRAYVRSKSAESVKAMAELRKVIGEDISKIIEKAHRLSGGFIAGVAALAAGLGIRLIMFTGREVSTALSLIFCFIFLAVIWSGLLLQRRVSSKSLVNDLRHMRKWHRNTHLALSRADYAELALAPVLDAIKLYKQTLRWTQTGMLIGSIVFLVAVAALPEIITTFAVDQPTKQLKE